MGTKDFKDEDFNKLYTIFLKLLFKNSSVATLNSLELINVAIADLTTI